MNRRTAILGLAGTAIAGSPHAMAQTVTPVTIDRTPGEGQGRRPAVLLLHGSDGVTRLSQYRVAATALARQGYTVFFPHYFESTGDIRASYREIDAKYPMWLNTLSRVLDDVANDRSIDARRMAVVGISLGGALALSLASGDARLDAVVSYFGFRPDDLESGRPRAPTLILHGDSDRLVPVRNATLIETTLRRRGVVVETQIYPGEGHGFGPAAQLDAATRTAAFLGRHLGA
jgi:carboxymethylenebutenolidase